MQQLTDKQQLTLDFIQRYIAIHTVAPKLQEIAEGIGTVHHVAKLFSEAPGTRSVVTFLPVIWNLLSTESDPYEETDEGAVRFFHLDEFPSNFMPLQLETVEDIKVFDGRLIVK